MNHELFEELIAADAVGALTKKDAKELHAHLSAGCPRCNELKASFAYVAQLLPESESSQRPPSRLKKKLMDELFPGAHAETIWPSWWRSWGFGTLAAAAVIAAVLPIFLRRPELGRLTNIQGAVYINDEPAAENAVLRAGQFVTTTTGSSVELKLGEKALVKIKPASEAIVKATAGGYDVNLRRGGAISLVKPGTVYAVVTSILRVEARGTGFFVEIEAPQRNYVCICSGHIVLKHESFSQDLQATHHKAVIADHSGGLLRTEPGTLVDHTDDEINQLASHFK